MTSSLDSMDLIGESLKMIHYQIQDILIYLMNCLRPQSIPLKQAY